jgi:hypothetical protein
MNVRRRLAVLAACTTLPVFGSGCGSSGGNGFAGVVGTYDSDADLSLGPGHDASAGPALEAHIEQNHIAIQVVTVSCAGPCADVVAVATGGHAPYTFTWEDGSTSTARHVCPSADTSYTVKVTDTATTGELGRAAQTVQVPLTANVIACPDAAAPPPTGCEVLLAEGMGAPDGGDSYDACATDGGPFVSSDQLLISLQTPLRAGQQYQITFQADDFAFGTPQPIDFSGALPAGCSSPTPGQLFGGIVLDPAVAHFNQGFCFVADADYPNVMLTQHVTGLAIGITTTAVVQVCGGCNLGDAGAD